jgi:hypothetical protein
MCLRCNACSGMSAKMTLDTYADLFDDDLDAVAVAHARYSPEVTRNCGHNAATERSES